jgi:hypothetical protein
MVLALAALVVALGGTAVAATATIVNIADPTTPANKVRVGPDGALKTFGVSTVSGTVAETAPAKSFFGQEFLSASGASNSVIGATNATLALTRIAVENYYDQVNGAHVRVTLIQNSGNASTCDGSTGSRTVGAYNVAAGQSFSDAMESPIVLKPLVAGDVWCLLAYASVQGSPSSGYYLPGIEWSGYVVSGALPASAAATPNVASGAPPKARG